MQEKPNKLRSVLHPMLPVLFIELGLSAIMLLVFACLSRLDRSVLLGAALGTALIVLNFFVMVITLMRAENSETPEKGVLAMRGTYALRLLFMAVVLIIALKTGSLNPLATLLPLCFMGVSTMLGSLFEKKGGGTQ